MYGLHPFAHRWNLFSALNLLAGGLTFSGLEIIHQGIEGEKAEDENIDRGDEQVAQYRVEIIEIPVEHAAKGCTDKEPTRKVTARETEIFPSFLMENTAHDRLGEDMEEVGTDRQDTLDAGAHQGRGDNKAAAGADTAGDKTGAEPDKDRGKEDEIGIVRWHVGRFTTEYIGQSRSVTGGDGDTADKDRQQHKEKNPFRLRLFRMLVDISSSQRAWACDPCTISW